MSTRCISWDLPLILRDVPDVRVRINKPFTAKLSTLLLHEYWWWLCDNPTVWNQRIMASTTEIIQLTSTWYRSYSMQNPSRERIVY